MLRQGGMPAIELAGLQDVVLAWAADSGVSTSEMSRRLRDEYAIDLSPDSIQKWVAKQRDSRRMAVAQAVAADPALRERMAEHITSDLDIVDEILRDLLGKYRAVAGVEAKVDLARALFDGLRTKAKIGGMDGGASSAVAAVAVVGAGRLRDLTEEELRQLLAAERSGADGSDGAPGPASVPEDGESGVPGGPEGSEEAGAPEEPRAASPPGRRAGRAGDTDGSAR